MRGEYLNLENLATGDMELPPHARRIRIGPCATHDGDGTTSACAENTCDSTAVRMTVGNYLRMRGEYTAPLPLPAGEKELPPHARRIQPKIGGLLLPHGTTSACAENTLGF